MRYTGGVDVGSTQTKAVILDEGGRVAGRALLDMETSMVTIAQDAFRAALADAGVEEAQVARIASTGYGRYNVSFGHEQVTEISCHARGAVALFPGTRTVLDIGGQDTKAIQVDPHGIVESFQMNDRCAAGCGRYLGYIADEMNISPGNLYYHFRNKDEIVGELFAAYESEATPLFVAPAGRAAGVEDLWLMLHLLFERMWTYRFLFRDLDELASRNRRLASRFAALVRRGESTVIELCEGMVAAGTMRASRREIAALARNVAIVATYSLSFQRIENTAAGEFPRLDHAAYQVLALVAPFMSGDSRALIERLGEQYL